LTNVAPTARPTPQSVARLEISLNPLPLPLPKVDVKPSKEAASAFPRTLIPFKLHQQGATESSFSPMVGTFYRTANPDSPAFVNVGDDVSAGKVVCIIEAMKLFNEIESEVSGKIVKILVDNASPVEYDQPLFLVEPA
jgi:acetyl-CoA carboxylase biotin carboxyl carrier protein